MKEFGGWRLWFGEAGAHSGLFEMAQRQGIELGFIGRCKPLPSAVVLG